MFQTRDNLPATRDTRRLDYLQCKGPHKATHISSLGYLWFTLFLAPLQSSFTEEFPQVFSSFLENLP